VTGTSRHEVHRILPEPIYNLFDGVVTGNDVRRGKPHPEPYLLALKKVQLRPEEAMVIENAPFGIRSAKSAGLVCIALETSLPRRYLAKADFIFSSFRELRKKLSLVR
jgi:beta-phosphoglucomutase